VLDKAEYSAFQSTLNSPIVSYRIVPNALVKNHNLCHKTISNLHYESYKHKHTHTHTHTHANTIRNTTSVVTVIVQSSSRSDKAVCSVRHEAIQDKPINKLRIESVTITAVLPSCLFPLPRYYRDVCPRYRHYLGKI